MRVLAGCLMAATLMAAPAMADEMWKTDIGPVMWEDDYNGGAIFMVEMGKGKVARFYIEGLKADDEARAHYNGYWINTADDGMCAAMMTGPDGTKSHNWGRLSMTFADETFRATWTMLTGDCMAEPDQVLVGKPDQG